MIQLGDPMIIGSSPMAKAWQKASEELGFRFISPYELKNEDLTCWVAGWIPDFGGDKGTIICGRACHDDALDIADSLGYYTSGLNPRYYERYNRERIIETLNDWGWKNKENSPPNWYSGGADVDA